MRGRSLAALVLGVGLICVAGPGQAQAATPLPTETPMLRAAVAAGALPGVAERLPAEPLVVALDGADLAPGVHGGTLRLLMARPRDVRMVGVYGYTRLVGYTPAREIAADVLARVENEGDRRFTLSLRPGHRWSDGHPFTTEYFRYYWQDVLQDPASGPPAALLVGRELPTVEIVDARTVRYSWSKPNPHFLPALAAARPLATSARRTI